MMKFEIWRMRRWLLSISLSLFAATVQTEESHLETVITVDDAVHLSARTGIGTHPVEVAQLIGKSRSQAIDEIVTGLRQDSDGVVLA